MPRQARLDAPGTRHHVIARGIERKPIFSGPEDYEDFVRAGAKQGNRPELVGDGLRRSCGAWPERAGRKQGEEQEPLAHDERVLGSREFVQDILADAQWERRRAYRKKIGLDELATRVLAVTGIPEEELRSPVKRPNAVAARRAFIEIAVRDYGYSAAAVARYLGVVASTTQRQAAVGQPNPLAERIREELGG